MFIYNTNNGKMLYKFNVFCGKMLYLYVRRKVL
jgi:hypothetical protein